MFALKKILVEVNCGFLKPLFSTGIFIEAQ